MKPLVSIVVPAYNAENWISATIQSALDQTWENKEVIVVDDGSKDRTLQVARAFEAKGVTVISQHNQGASTARNTGYAAAKGDYIQWLDADDLMAPDKISAQLDLLGARPDPRVLLSGAWGSFYYRTSKARFRPTPLWRDLSPAEFITIKLGQADCFMQTAVWLVSRELSEAAGPWNTTLTYDDDGEYFCRVLMASAGTKFVSDSKVYYRVTDSGRLSYVGTSPRKLQSVFDAMTLQVGYLRSLADSPATQAASVRYLQRYFHYFYRERPDLVLQLEQMAREMGGKLVPPRTRWKFYWIQKLFGWNAAKRAQFFFPGLKGSVVQKWDRWLFRMHDKEAR